MSDNEVDARLPRTAIPSRYELVLEPDLDAATFTGTEAVTIDIVEPVSELVLNAIELTIDDAWVETPTGARVDASVSYDEATERATLALPLTLEPGAHTLHAGFAGILNDKLHGFYRSTFVDAEGNERTLATTQFESTDARRAFPCWDEPDFKAAFAVTLVVPEELLAVSNAAEVSREPTGDGRVRVTFADTMVMSTYLVAFVVGPLTATEAVDVDGVPLRVVHAPGKEPLTAFALEIGAFALRFFGDYFGITYPGGKVDLLAIPDFAFGAMENLGCVTFREAVLLVDPDKATQPELDRVANVVSHELAHMWFGDLVTMRWWNGIWLNEAFATFMATTAVDAWRPDWHTWADFALERTAAFDTDALANTRPIEYPVRTPRDAEGMFDVLTYEKGCSVVRMLEQYLGAARFRDGIRQYIAKHAHANTETHDLWDALEAATGEPVRRIADSWIFQGGHPQVGIELVNAGRTLRLTQEGFRYRADGTNGTVEAPATTAAGETRDPMWVVPAMLRIASTTGDISRRPVLLDGKALDVELADPATWAIANADANGFYRVRYSPELLAALVADGASQLSAVERYTIVDDTAASMLAGSTTAADLLRVIAGLTDETDLSVWRRMVGALATLDRICPDDVRPQLQTFVRNVTRPALDRVGDEPSPSEPDRVTTLRAVLFETLGVLGRDESTLARAGEIDRRSAAEPGSVDAALADAAVRVIAPSGDRARFQDFLARAKAASVPQDVLRYLGAMADFENAELYDDLCGLTLLPDVRSQDVGLVLNRALANRPCGPRGWRFISANWAELLARMPGNMAGRFITGVRTFTDRQLADDVEAFMAEHPVPSATKQVAQHIERMKVTVALAEREGGNLGSALATTNAGC